MVNVADAPVMLAGFGVIVRPGGTPAKTRFTTPLNPPARAIFTVAVVLLPCGVLIEVGAKASEKLGAVNVAVTLLELGPDTGTDGVNVHVVVLATQAPDQPAKVLPAAGVAVSVNGVALKLAVHELPQLMPAGVDVTVPEPGPARVTVTCGGIIKRVNIGGWPPTTSLPLTKMTRSKRPPGASGATAIVSVLEVVRRVTTLGSNVAVTPVGRPPTPSVTSPLVLPCLAMLTVTVLD